MPDPNRQSVDFVVESPDHQVRLLVEAKNTTAPSPQWPVRFMRNLFTHGALRPSDFFILALRDHFFLWHRPDPTKDLPPDAQADTVAVLEPYLRNFRASLDTLSETGFEQLVYAWLNDLVAGWPQPAPGSDWLKDSHLRETLRDGIIKSQDAA
jgi:hypothetical protein